MDAYLKKLQDSVDEYCREDDISCERKKYPCPVCESPNQFFMKWAYEICHVCGWKDDPTDVLCPDEDGGNRMSFYEARAMWKRGETLYPGFPMEEK